MKIEELSKELIEAAKGCETPEGRIDFVKLHHIDLTREQMGAIGGGTINPHGTPKKPAGDEYCPASGSCH